MLGNPKPPGSQPAHPARTPTIQPRSDRGDDNHNKITSP